MWLSWFRMPKQEFEVDHQFRHYYIIGQLDTSKEVLIPKKKVINGKKIDGYDVISPVYCYETGNYSLMKIKSNEDPYSIVRAALIVNRGWIPESRKDKKYRPEENTMKL